MAESLQWPASCCSWRTSKCWAAWPRVSAARRYPPARYSSTRSFHVYMSKHMCWKTSTAVKLLVCLSEFTRRSKWTFILGITLLLTKRSAWRSSAACVAAWANRLMCASCSMRSEQLMLSCLWLYCVSGRTCFSQMFAYFRVSMMFSAATLNWQAPSCRLSSHRYVYIKFGVMA